MIHTEIEIDAPLAVTCEAFFDFSAIPSYSEALKQITPKNPERRGRPEVGDIVTVTAGNMTFDAPVEVSSETEFAWRGTLINGWVFTGAHNFKFLAAGESNEKTRLVHSEQFGGLLAPVFSVLAGGTTERTFRAFNEDLKKYVEARK